MPTVTRRIVFYELMLPIMEARYGFIDPKGQFATIGQQGMELNQFFEIDEEQK
ncbi:hypothetical protein [Paenibacillus monticola]|uniref:Uncharacterized protein n=1 Tax=Paenibacillus monticola TaxID=2666075 RepID=A0A7X2H3Q8_9BACL|nr:hypothetical protein [Paenibacillus monticola]MRN53024.1 hypothetical protein [Paenibacillus monticola]